VESTCTQHGLTLAQAEGQRQATRPGLAVRGTSSLARAYRHGDRALVGRFIVFLMGKRIVVLHASTKKAQQTPDNDLKMARKRLKEVMHG